MGVLPTSTTSQRMAAHEKAAHARRHRVQLRQDLESGTTTTFAAVLDRADVDDVLANAKLRYILESLPKVGRITATGILEQVRIAESRGLRGLGERQRTELLALLS